jgi:hypothetical protein
MSSEMTKYFESTGTCKSTPSLGNQPAIDTSFEHLVQQDLHRVNHAKMDMAIANFFHCDNIPDSAAESSRFALVIKYAALVGKDYKIPNRRKIGGPLLDLNYENCKETNKVSLLAEADTFGLVWLSDGATIHRMPLINILGVCANHHPTCVKIEDCTGHMTEGGKKDASYIAQLLEDVVSEYDPLKTRTNIFFFDGASNVRKAGLILQAKFPRATALWGGEHVCSLFFVDLSKFKAVKVCLSSV